METTDVHLRAKYKNSHFIHQVITKWKSKWSVVSHSRESRLTLSVRLWAGLVTETQFFKMKSCVFLSQYYMKIQADEE